MQCFRCGGKGTLSDRHDETCFVCHGKGNIKIPIDQLDKYFSRFREKSKKRRD